MNCSINSSVELACAMNLSSISLQIGAQVMLLRNLELTSNDRMLVNGSRGVITKFIPKDVSSDPSCSQRYEL